MKEKKIYNVHILYKYIEKLYLNIVNIYSLQYTRKKKFFFIDIHKN